MGGVVFIRTYIKIPAFLDAISVQKNSVEACYMSIILPFGKGIKSSQPEEDGLWGIIGGRRGKKGILRGEEDRRTLLTYT
jgi:hypothetical protein